MHLHFLAAGALAAFAAMTPAAALAQTAPSAAPASPGMPAIPAGVLPFSQSSELEAAHVWVMDGATRRELHQTQSQVSQSNISGMPGAGAMASNMAKGFAQSALAIAGGPIGMIASSAFSLFGHHAQAQPKFHATLALSGAQSSTAIRSSSTTFECNYANVPGVDPDAYTPQILQLTATKDNWRIVTVSTSNDASSVAALMMPAAMANMANMARPGSHEQPKLEETPVSGASIQILGRGTARITLASPLPPGEYGIVLRPVANAQPDSLQRVLRTVWDFTIPGSAAQQ